MYVLWILQVQTVSTKYIQYDQLVEMFYLGEYEYHGPGNLRTVSLGNINHSKR